jgi:hypothetical protein
MITHEQGRSGPPRAHDDVAGLFTGSYSLDNENSARDAGKHRRK